MTDCFSCAALRHFEDATHLLSLQRFDNAMYLYGYATECALKALIELKGHVPRIHRIHNMNVLAPDALTALGVLDSSLALAISAQPLPPKLCQGHPERRYWDDGAFAETDANVAKSYSEALVNILVKIEIDGIGV